MQNHYKAILRLGTPIAIGQLGIIIMGFADTMMVGRYSTDALASASFVNSVFNLVAFLIMGYSYGLTPIISSLYGQGLHRKAGDTLKQAIGANGLYAALLLGVMIVAYFFLDSMGQPAQLLSLIRPYYLCTLLSMCFVALFNVLRQFTDGITHTATAMWALLISNAINIVGNYLLIYGIGPFPELGLIGAGYSTLFARFMMAFILIVLLLKGKRYAIYRKGFAAARLRWMEVRYVHRQSFPISLQMGMENGAFSLSGIMAGWLGALPLATYQVIITISTLGFMFYYSYGAGTSIRVATFYGQQDWKQAAQATRACRHILLALSTIVCLVFLFGSQWLIQLFTADPAVVGMAASVIPALILYQYGDAMQICYANALRGTSHVRPMMWIAFISYLLINVPSGYVLGFPVGLGLRGIFLAFSLGLFSAAILFYRQYNRVMRKAMQADNLPNL